MPNTIIISDLAAKTAAAEFETEGMAIQTTDRSWEPEFKQSGYQPGTSIRIRKPTRFTSFQSETATVNNITEEYAVVTLLQYGVATLWSDVEKQLKIDPKKLDERVLKPMANELVSKVELTILQTMANYSLMDAGSTPGTAPGTFRIAADGYARLQEQRAGMANETFGAYSYTAQAATLDGTKALFNPTTSLSNQYVTGRLKNIAGVNMYASPSVYRLTNGTILNSDTPLINGVLGAGSNVGTTVIIKSAGASKTITAGMAFTVAGVTGIDPQSKTNLPSLKVFRVLTATSTDGSGDATLTITEAMVISGTTQNMSGVSGTDAAVTWYNGTVSASSYQNLIYKKASTAVVCLPLSLPEGNNGLASIRNINGISVKSEFWRDAGNSKEYLRMDLLLGIVVLRPEWIATAWGE